MSNSLFHQIAHPKPLPGSLTHNASKNTSRPTTVKSLHNLFLSSSRPHTLTLAWALRNQIPPTLTAPSPFFARKIVVDGACQLPKFPFKVRSRGRPPLETQAHHSTTLSGFSSFHNRDSTSISKLSTGKPRSLLKESNGLFIIHQ